MYLWRSLDASRLTAVLEWLAKRAAPERRNPRQDATHAESEAGRVHLSRRPVEKPQHETSLVSHKP